MDKKVVIVSAVRTPIGAFEGSLSSITVCDLGAIVIKESIKRAGLEMDQIDEVIMGNVLQSAQGQNTARQAALKAGVPVETPAWTLNKVCGSGLKAVICAAQAIITGDADIIVAGGMENMSLAPYALPKARQGYRMGNNEVIDTMIKDGLFDSIHDIHMGITAENIAEKHGISRETQDKVALNSQMRAKVAINSGKFDDEIVKIEISSKKGTIIVDKDEYPKLDTDREKLAKLSPAFKKGGTVTAGNASGINDGAAAMVVMSEAKAKELGLEPLATIKSWASAGVNPLYMGEGPIPATQKALAKAGLTIDEIDIFELNEAFASQSIAVTTQLNIKEQRVNINGGAIALGHPIGASGARILITLMYEMNRRQSNKGLATLCIGGGQGIAMVVER